MYEVDYFGFDTKLIAAKLQFGRYTNILDIPLSSVHASSLLRIWSVLVSIQAILNSFIILPSHLYMKLIWLVNFGIRCLKAVVLSELDKMPYPLLSLNI